MGCTELPTWFMMPAWDSALQEQGIVAAKFENCPCSSFCACMWCLTPTEGIYNPGRCCFPLLVQVMVRSTPSIIWSIVWSRHVGCGDEYAIHIILERLFCGDEYCNPDYSGKEYLKTSWMDCKELNDTQSISSSSIQRAKELGEAEWWTWDHSLGRSPALFCVYCDVTHIQKRHCDPAEVSTSSHTEYVHDSKFTVDLTMLCELEVWKLARMLYECNCNC